MRTSSWALAARTLWRSKVRAALMGLGLLIGVVSIALTVATGEGARQAVEKSFRSMVGNLDVLFVQPGGSAQRGMASLESSIATLTVGDAQAIAASVPNVRAVGAQQSAPGAPVEVNGRNGTTFLFGSSANWNAIRGDSLKSGRYLAPSDGAALARVALLGADVAKEFFPGAEAVGQHVRLRDIDFEVVGVLAANGAGPGGVSIDALVYIPLETAQRRVFNRDYLSLVSVKLVDARRWGDTQAAVTALLRQRHARQPGTLNDFRVSSPQAMMARMASVDSTLRTALLWIGFLALAIGGVVVANLMFAATVARRREIATRRALGATRRDVLRQFWAEAALVSLSAAGAGAVLSVGAILAGARLMHIPLAVSWTVTFGTVVVTAGVGVLAGYFPARRAAAMSPAAALSDAA